MQKKYIDIVIVNYNSGDCLGNCLKSLNKYDSEIISSINVVDNFSLDGSQDIEVNDLINVKNRIKISKEQINHGFAKACNIGANKGSAEFILFLNPDTYLFQDIFEDINNIGKEDLHNQITGARLLDDHGNSSISAANFPTFSMLLIKIFGLHKFFQNLEKQLITFYEDGRHTVEVASGAFFLISRKAFKNLQGFDERFFVYYEEVDLALRARNLLDINCVIESSIKLKHIGGGCTKSSIIALSYNIQSKLKYSQKHFNSAQHYILLFAVLFFEIPVRILININNFKTLLPLLKIYTKLTQYVGRG